MLVGLQDPKGQRFPSQVDIGMCPKKALHPFPGERAGELTTTADQRGLGGFVGKELQPDVFTLEWNYSGLFFSG